MKKQQPKAEDSKRMTFDMPVSLYDWLSKKAMAEERSVSAQLRFILEQYRILYI